MARAAQHPIPVILELGGKDAMLVFSDANLKRAVKAALYGAFSNSGQVCVSVERCYVETGCYADFVAMLKIAVAELKVGHGAVGDLGGLTTLKQYAVIERHYLEALAKGATASAPLQLEGRYLHPVVLWNVTQDMLIMREETFGPLLPVMAFATEQQAINLANDSDFGLNASVWSTDIAKAERVARQLQVGNWAVNDVIKNIGHAGLPFGGVKNSGFGRYHGAEGLRQFSYIVAGLTSRSPLNDEPNWFPYSDKRYLEMRGFIDFMFGSGSLYRRIARNWQALQGFRGYASLNLRQHWRNLLIFMLQKS
jgi:acyl-CoA reductase-like NAD-dependent aldehyde dehydrogenase